MYENYEIYAYKISKVLNSNENLAEICHDLIKEIPSEEITNDCCNSTCTLFFSKNTFCKNSEAQIVKKLRTIQEQSKKYLDDNMTTF